MEDLTAPTPYGELATPDLLTRMFGWGSGPSGALEEFLLTDLDNLVEHQRVMAYVIYRYKMAIQDCNKLEREYSRHIADLKITALAHWRGAKQTGADRYYSFEEAKEMRGSDPTLRNYARLRDEVLDRRESHMAYLKAIEIKCSLSPGLQGLYNRICEDQ